jgi:hypothetical protein
MIHELSRGFYRFGLEYVFNPAVEISRNAEHHFATRLNVIILKPCNV